MTLAQGHRIDWNRIMLDLSGRGMSIRDIAAITGIPRSNLGDYKNLDKEPRHADGEQILTLWRLKMVPDVPIVRETVRQHHVRV